MCTPHVPYIPRLSAIRSIAERNPLAGAEAQTISFDSYSEAGEWAAEPGGKYSEKTQPGKTNFKGGKMTK